MGQWRDYLRGENIREGGNTRECRDTRENIIAITYDENKAAKSNYEFKMKIQSWKEFGCDICNF